MNQLTDAQIERYRRDGFLFPLPGLSERQVAAYRADLEAFERREGVSITTLDARFKSHTLFPWANRLVREPTILDVIEDLVGPDILVWTSTFFVKEPHAPAVTLWHQDWTFFGLRPHEHVTAWIALSDASVQAGCMRFVPGEGRAREMRHQPWADPNSINGGAQTIVEPFDESGVVHATLRPGEFSLHHTLCIHSSAPNRTGARRIGLGISYIPTSVRHTGTLPVSTMLVRGVDRYGHFELEQDPTGDYEQDRLRHGDYYRRYRTAYNEQVRWHTAGRAA